MKISYDTEVDLLYIRFDTEKQKVNTKIINDNIILDLSMDGKLVGIEIIEASQLIKLEQLFPIHKEKFETNLIA